MRIDRNVIDRNLSQSEIDLIVNRLIMNLNEFSGYACIDGQACGVTIPLSDCKEELNHCVIKHLVELLISAHELVEKRVGYDITPQYHIEELPWKGRSRILTLRPGIEALHVKQSVSDVLASVSISPFIQENLPAQEIDGFVYVSVDRDLVQNPERIVVRDNAYQSYKIQKRPGYPKINGTNWEIALDRGATVDKTYHAQHKSLMYVDVPTQLCEGSLLPVYPDSMQIIPQALAPEVVLDDLDAQIGTRHWFHSWNLGKSEFDSIDLEYAEFYKLIESVDFRCFYEETIEPVVVFYEDNGCTRVLKEETGVLDIELIDAYNGVVAVRYTGTNPYLSEFIRIRFGYKTNPALLGYNDTYLLQEAVANLVAAELPLSTCRCEIETGFIHAAQQPYTDIRVNPITGENIINLKHGNLYGQLVYEEKMRRANKYKRVVRV